MAVFRVERNTGYTVMSNHHLRNKELSLKAKGLLSQMLSLPEDWDYTLAGLSYINRESIQPFSGLLAFYREMVFTEIAFQNSCRLCSIRERKPDMLTAFLLQLSKTFFFQQCTVVDNSNIVSQQGNLRKNVTGNQNRFSLCVAKLPNKGAYLRNTDGIKTVDRLIQNQKFWIVHNGKGDGKPLLHTKRIL